MTARRKTKVGKDKRRKHHHFQVILVYRDGEKFARTYTDRAKAAAFADRQKRSPIVKSTRIVQAS